MKKILTIAVVFIFLSSCKGDYDCVCTVNGVSQSALKYYNVQRAYAKESCSVYEDQLTNTGAKCRIEKL